MKGMTVKVLQRLNRSQWGWRELAPPQVRGLCRSEARHEFGRFGHKSPVVCGRFAADTLHTEPEDGLREVVDADDGGPTWGRQGHRVAHLGGAGLAALVDRDVQAGSVPSSVGLYVDPPEGAVVFSFDRKPSARPLTASAVGAHETRPGSHGDPRLPPRRSHRLVRRP